MSLTTNQREKQLHQSGDGWLVVIFIITFLVTGLSIATAMKADEISDHKSKQIREQQKVIHGCDRCYELMHGRRK